MILTLNNIFLPYSKIIKNSQNFPKSGNFYSCTVKKSHLKIIKNNYYITII